MPCYGDNGTTELHYHLYILQKSQMIRLSGKLWEEAVLKYFKALFQKCKSSLVKLVHSNKNEPKEIKSHLF
jgi:hypothetical protein